MSTEVATFVGQHLARLEHLEALVIQDAAGERDAVDGLAFIQGLKRTLDQVRREQVDPLNAQVKAINESFRPHLDTAAHVEACVKQALLDWRAKETARIACEQARVREENARLERERAAEQARREDEARARTEASGGFLVEDVAPVAVPARLVAPSAPLPTVTATLGSATVRRVWTFTIDAPLQVPREYLSVDETALRRAVAGGARVIPGVRIFEQEQIAGHRR